jgi:hypothetical protein
MRRRRIGRLLVALLAAVGALEVAYVAAGLYLVRSGQVERWINKHPEKLRVTFDSAWTVIPGVVHFRGFRIVQQGRGSQLEGVVDRGWGVVELLELPARRIHVVGLRAHGVEFRLRRRPKTAEETAAGPPPMAPPVEGAPWEPWSGPPPGPRKPARWAVVVTGAVLDDVRDVWIHDRRLTGPGSVAASVTVGRDKRISISGVDARFEGARSGFGQETAFSDLTFRLRGSMQTFDPKETKGLALVSLVRADLDFAGRLPSAAALLNYYLRGAPWVRFSGGEARVTARFGVDGGRLRPGGWIELAPTQLRAGFAGFTAEGAASTRLDVAGEGDAAEALLGVTFDAYALRRDAAPDPPVMRGRKLAIDARAPASLAQLPPPDFAGRIDVGEAELPDLTFVNEYLPGGGGVRVKRGSARAEGSFDLNDGGHSCKGSLKVTGQRLVLDAAGVETSGAVSIALAVPRGDILSLDFGVDGTRVDLDRFAFATADVKAGPADWSGGVSFPAARLDMSGALKLEGRVEMRASDTRPLVAFLSADKPLKGWKKRLLSVEEVRGGGRFHLGDGTVAVDDFRVAGGPIELRARARVTPDGAFGKVLARYGILKAGIELKGRDRSLHAFRPEHWFEQR